MILVAMLALQTAAPTASPIPPTTGETRNCIEPRRIQSTRLSAAHGYFVRLGTRDWWRNAAGGCPAYAPRRAISTFSNTERQCAGDQVQVFEAFTRIAFGGCRLGRWEKLTGAPDLPDK